MTCDERDQELLLLAHGAISLPRRVAIRAHLRRCAACRERYSRLTQVSITLSAALGAPARLPWTPAWKPAGLRGATLGSRLLAVGSVLLIALTATILYLTFFNSASSCASNTPPVAAKSSDGCAPNLPNDRCR